MATSYKVLGTKMSVVNFNDWTAIYTVPTGKMAVISSISISNTYNSGNQNYMGIAVLTSSSPNPATLVPPTPISAGTRVCFTEGWTLSAGESILVEDLSNDIHYALFGSEMDA